MFLHLKIKFITRHSIFFSIYENWEIRIIVAYSWYIIEKGYKYEDGIDGNIKNVLMAMESGNIDRLLTAIDEAIERADARNAEAKKVMKTDIK